LQEEEPGCGKTEWRDEFAEKVAQNVAQHIFLSTLIQKFHRGKSRPKCSPTHFFSIKKLIQANNRSMADFRLLRSHCHRSLYILLDFNTTKTSLIFPMNHVTMSFSQCCKLTITLPLDVFVALDV
jgi:hypothetical protein